MSVSVCLSISRVGNECARPPDMSGSHMVVICSEEQLKVDLRACILLPFSYCPVNVSPHDAMLTLILAMALCLCLSQVGVLLKRMNESISFLACEVPSIRPTL